MATTTMVVEVSINRATSLARRLVRPSQPKVRSITQRLGMISNAFGRERPFVGARCLLDDHSGVSGDMESARQEASPKLSFRDMSPDVAPMI